jgi:hypothetical protein
LDQTVSPNGRVCEITELLATPWWTVARSVPRDPELRKVLGRICNDIRETDRLEAAGKLLPAAKARAQDLLAIDLRTLRLDAALETVDGWDQLVIEHGDERFLCTLLETEYARALSPTETTVATWKMLFGVEPVPALQAFRSGQPVGEADLQATRNRLAALYRTRSTLYALDRARMAMKARHLWLMAPVLLALIGACMLAARLSGSGWSSVFLAGLTGALGGAIAGAYKLRDHIVRINQLRAFAPGIVVQPLLGAGAGLFLLFVIDSGLVKFGDVSSGWQLKAALAFVAGFSEPFFLGVVNRVAGIEEKHPTPGAAPATQQS